MKTWLTIGAAALCLSLAVFVLCPDVPVWRRSMGTALLWLSTALCASAYRRE